MKIQNTQNCKYTPSFGTYLGINMQEKILLAKQRNLFSQEQLANLNKIENDGIEAFLDIATKYIIHSTNKRKGTMQVHRHLVLKNDFNKTSITNVDDLYRELGNNKISFLMHKFTHLFDDKFALAEKIKTAWETLSNNSH